MKYFAYGSNMSISRLRKHVPSAERVGTFTLGSHDLRFHKTSKDGSGKCDAFETENPADYVIGALFEINEDEKPDLDRAEGLGYGYEEKIVSVSNECGDSFEAVTYYATNIDESLQPYSWYVLHVIVGAKETAVSAHYLQKIESITSIEDPDKNRDARERAIHS